jgi:hypothetical protein
MPDQLLVPEDLFDTVHWNTVQLTLVVIQVEKWKEDFQAASR